MVLVGRAMYLIGPSNVGKTSAARALADRGGVELIELDEILHYLRPDVPRILAAQDWDGLVLPLLTDLERTDSEPPVLVDIGAGTQDIDRALESPFLSQFLRRHRRRVILAEGNWDQIFMRSKAHSTQASSTPLSARPSVAIYMRQQVTGSGLPMLMSTQRPQRLRRRWPRFATALVDTS